MKRYAIPVLLVTAGVLLFLIGGLLLFAPHGFFADNGVTLGSDPNLMSEIRAPAGLLVASGAFIAISAVSRRLMPAGLGLAAMVYGAYGLSRAVSLGLDGMPSQGIVAAMAIELVVCALALVAFRFRQALAA